MAESVLRMLALLKSVPRYPAKKSARALCQTLVDAGYSTTLRSVQRDLDALSVPFPLIREDEGKTRRWSWHPDAPALDLPAMDGALALALRIVELHAPATLPPQLAAALRPYFLRAGQVLSDAGGAPVGTWLDRLRVIPSGMPLQPPALLSAGAAAIVYDAVLRQRRFKAQYRSRDRTAADAPLTYDVNPLGLVVKGPVVYLVCTLWSYTDVRHLALHRFEHAELLEAPAVPPANFDLDAYLREGAFGLPYGSPIRLRLRVSQSIADHLAEQPLSGDQRIDRDDADQAVVTAMVADSGQLRWWLMGFGDLVEVLEPAGLRAELAATFEAAAGRYRKVPVSQGENA